MNKHGNMMSEVHYRHLMKRGQRFQFLSRPGVIRVLQSSELAYAAQNFRMSHLIFMYLEKFMNLEPNSLVYINTPQIAVLTHMNFS